MDDEMNRAHVRDYRLKRECSELEADLRALASRLGGTLLSNDATQLADKLKEKQAQIVRTWD